MSVDLFVVFGLYPRQFRCSLAMFVTVMGDRVPIGCCLSLATFTPIPSKHRP